MNISLFTNHNYVIARLKLIMNTLYFRNERAEQWCPLDFISVGSWELFPRDERYGLMNSCMPGQHSERYVAAWSNKSSSSGARRAVETGSGSNWHSLSHSAGEMMTMITSYTDDDESISTPATTVPVCTRCRPSVRPSQLRLENSCRLSAWRSTSPPEMDHTRTRRSAGRDWRAGLSRRAIYANLSFCLWADIAVGSRPDTAGMFGIR